MADLTAMSFPLDRDDHDNFGAGPGTTFGDDRCFVFLPDALVDELGCPDRIVVTVQAQPNSGKRGTTDQEDDRG